MNELLKQIGRLGRRIGWLGFGMAVYIGYSEYERYKLETKIEYLRGRINDLEGV